MRFPGTRCLFWSRFRAVLVLVLVSPACVSVLFLTVPKKKKKKIMGLFAAEALLEQENTRSDLQ